MAEQIEGDRPGSDVRAVPPEWHLAKEIRIERAPDGAPLITIDGQFLPWLTNGVDVPAPARDKMPSVTVTFIADKVEMSNALPAPTFPKQ